nr:hypothetical protein [Tanacetum cinerariifolium]
MTSFGYCLNPRYAIKECLSCGALYTGDFCCSKGNVGDKLLVPKLPKNYARYGHPINGPYCQGCSLLRKKLEEDLVTYFPDFQNTSESSDDSFNCGGPHETFQCQQVIFYMPCCENCKVPHENFQCEPLNYYEDNPSYDSNYSGVDKSGDFHPQQYPCCDNCEGLHETFQCQPTNQNFYNSNSSGFDQTQPPQFPVIHPPPQETSIETLHDQENVINSVQTFLRKFNRYFFFETPKILLLAWDRVFVIKNAFGNKQYKPEDMQKFFRKIFNDVQNIHEELAEYINTPGWNRPALYDDDDDELAHIISPPKYDCFYFWNLPDPGELIYILNSGIRENLSSTTRVNLPFEDDHSPLLACVV